VGLLGKPSSKSAGSRVIRDFHIDHAAEQIQGRAPELVAILKMAFPDATSGKYFPAGSIENRSGIDCSVAVPHGPAVMIDWKLRKRQWGDIALEFKHEHDDGRITLGWVADTGKLCNLFGYVFMPTWTCWFLPREATQKAWDLNKDEWLRSYGEARSRNPDYWSVSCPVPTSVVRKEIGGVRIVTPSAVEAIDRYPDGPFEHYCRCGAWGAFGYGVHLRSGKLGAWYCREHRPKATA